MDEVSKSSIKNTEFKNSVAGKVDFYNERQTGNIFLETSKEQEIRVKANSPFKHLTTWKLIRFMVKSNDDVR